MPKPTDIITNMLRVLIPAIEEIDGGCPDCINAFIYDANIGIRKCAVVWHYRFDEATYTRSADIRVTLEPGFGPLTEEEK